uniref:Uncharacterized protein n=1 Tax=Avena sativa TaxID=4498 RepID=A0ACD5UKU3_AVESA
MWRAWLLAAVLVATTHGVAAAAASSTQLPAADVVRPPVAAQYNNPAGGAFREAPAFRNGDACRATMPGTPSSASSRVHIAMTLDANYLRGTVAAVFSILRHTACPEDVTFHFLASRRRDADAVRATFPYLDPRRLHVYRFDPSRVSARISRSVRSALDQPLNYARIYLADILPRSVRRVIYLDSDLVVVDDIQKLWSVDLAAGSHVVAAPEYCHTNFTKYFTDAFWSDASLSATFQQGPRRRRRPCYFNTGVMVMDVARWRQGGYSRRVEEWMAVQKEEKRIYSLGSLPPFLLVLAGEIMPVDHRWNQHGLGGDNVEGRCRSLHPGPISLLHWSGKGKPWLRLDSRKPCAVDHLWAPYDLYKAAAATAIEE